MRIGIDVRLQNESGVGRYIRNLVKYLKQIDKKNEYILFNPDVRWHTFKEQIVMPYILLRKKLDLVHFPYFNVPILYPGKFVVTIHDLTIDYFATGKASKLHPILYRVKHLGYKFVLWNAVLRAETIITPTKAVKGEILNKFEIDPGKLAVTYEGVDEKLKIENSKLKIDIKPRRYFLYVGNAYPHKNIETLLRAFQRLKTHNLKLVLVGEEDYFYQQLKGLVKKMKLDNRVIFTGYVADEELSGLYRNALALVLPSFMEGFGLPAVEAMQSKCLVLASDIPALREVCQNVAVYFNPLDLDDLATKMEEVLKEPQKLKQRQQEGLERVSKFSWRTMAQKTLKVYEGSTSI